MKNLIYGLVDPNSKQLRYVGQTRRGLPRIREHWRPSSLKREGHTHKSRWLLSLGGQRPDVVVIQVLEDDEWLNEAEIGWLSYFRSLGFPLVNGTAGGGGVAGWHHSQVTKDRLSRAHRGRKRPDAARWVSEALKGRPKSPDHAAKARIAAPRKAILDQNGVKYTSIREAARTLKLNKASIWKVLKGQLRTTGGYSFVEVE